MVDGWCCGKNLREWVTADSLGLLWTSRTFGKFPNETPCPSSCFHQVIKTLVRSESQEQSIPPDPINCQPSSQERNWRGHFIFTESTVCFGYHCALGNSPWPQCVDISGFCFACILIMSFCINIYLHGGKVWSAFSFSSYVICLSFRKIHTWTSRWDGSADKSICCESLII